METIFFLIAAVGCFALGCMYTAMHFERKYRRMTHEFNVISRDYNEALEACHRMGEKLTVWESGESETDTSLKTLWNDDV
jgi:hypothetical protein